MHKENHLLRATLSLGILSWLTILPAFAGSNFTIIPTPGLSLPTSILPGQLISAYYTITNQTKTIRDGYVIQGLPSTVVQNTSNTTYCQNPIELGPFASCILQLDITGETQSSFALCKGLSCTTAAMPLTITTGTISPMVAAGFYRNSESISYPLLATSTNSGSTWTYSIDSARPLLPSNFAGGQFNSTSCAGINCVAAGSYFNGITYPLLATSTNGGSTWTYTIDDVTPTVPSDFILGTFFSTSCANLNCVAAGTYRNDEALFPLLATSMNGGVTWTYTIDSTTPTLSGGFDGEFHSTSCAGDNCVVAGSYTFDTTTYPLLATSTNGGSTWVYTINSDTPSPSDFISGNFGSTSCVGDHCVAAGVYFNGTNNYPLLATSENGGSVWAYTIDSTTPSLPSDFLSGQFLGTSCAGLLCVAAGYYTTGFVVYPLLATSTNGGLVWSYQIDSNTPSPSDFTNGHFESTSCADLHCVASGSYSTIDFINYPLLATSTNGGSTWTYTIDSSTPSLPSNFSSGEFKTASCTGLYCVAAGSYFDSNSIRYPLLASSTNGGSTWTYTIDSLTPTLPSSFSEGQFMDTSSNTLSTTGLFTITLGWLITEARKTDSTPNGIFK